MVWVWNSRKLEKVDICGICRYGASAGRFNKQDGRWEQLQPGGLKLLSTLASANVAAYREALLCALRTRNCISCLPFYRPRHHTKGKTYIHDENPPVVWISS